MRTDEAIVVMDLHENLKAENARLRAALEDTTYPLGEIEDLMKQVASLRAALKPFADAVYNDNGDMTIDHAGIGIDQFAKAYFVMRRADEQTAGKS